MHNPIYKVAQSTAFVTPVVEHWLERDKHVNDTKKETVIDV